MAHQQGTTNLMEQGGGELLLERLPEGHVIHTLVSEHVNILGLLREIDRVRVKLLTLEALEEDRDTLENLRRVAEYLLETENHHLREERVLFAEMEKRGIVGPSQVIRQEHELLRHLKKRLVSLSSTGLEKKSFSTVKTEVDETADRLISNLVAHIHKEDYVLYPAALQVIDDPPTWDSMRERCDEIGYGPFTPASATAK